MYFNIIEDANGQFFMSALFADDCYLLKKILRSFASCILILEYSILLVDIG